DPLVAIFKQAVAKYQDATGIDLLAQGPAVPASADEIFDYINQHETEFKKFREDGHHSLLHRVRPVADVVGTLCMVVGEGAGVKFPYAKAIFAGVSELVKAAMAVHEDFEAICAAFETMEHHIRVIQPIPTADIHQALREPSAKLLAQILVVLGLTKKLQKEKRIITWLKKLAQSKDVSSALDDLGRIATGHHQLVSSLTLDTVTKTMSVLEASVFWDKQQLAGTRSYLVELMRIARKIYDKMITNRAILENVQKALLRQTELMDNNQSKADIKELCQWLQFPDCSVKMNNLLDERAPSTGTWFLDGDEFTAFKKCMTKVLWLHGKAGSGKSTMMAAAIRDLEAHAASFDATSVVLTHLFDTTSSSQPRTLRVLLSSLLCQLAYSRHELAARLVELRKSTSIGHSQLSLETMRISLDTLLTTTRLRLFIVVDALDEANDPAVLLFLAHLRTHINVSLMVSSRYEVCFREDLEALSDSRVAIDERRVTGDINTFLATLLNKGGLLSQVGDTDVVQETLIAGADGKSVQFCVYRAPALMTA
ncbi:hypothetical protein BD626DRAFT_416155, partial [Schizophyllum amplum]